MTPCCDTSMVHDGGDGWLFGVVSANKWTVARGEWARKDEDKADDD